jgi:ribosomal protein L4
MKVLFISDIDKVDVWKSARNISTVLTTTVDYLLIEDILGAGKILVTQDVLEKIQGGLIK